MDKELAIALVESELKHWRTLAYSELLGLIKTNRNKEVVAEDGRTYQLEIDVMWDGASKDIRVFVSVDDGGWRAFFPLTRDLIMRPDGTFVGE